MCIVARIAPLRDAGSAVLVGIDDGDRVAFRITLTRDTGCDMVRYDISADRARSIATSRRDESAANGDGQRLTVRLGKFTPDTIIGKVALSELPPETWLAS